VLATREGAVNCCLFRSREGGVVSGLACEDGPEVRRRIAWCGWNTEWRCGEQGVHIFVPSPSPSIRVGHSGDMGGIATRSRSVGAIFECVRNEGAVPRKGYSFRQGRTPHRM